jgi:hypothetical protein
MQAVMPEVDPKHLAQLGLCRGLLLPIIALLRGSFHCSCRSTQAHRRQPPPGHDLISNISMFNVKRKHARVGRDKIQTFSRSREKYEGTAPPISDATSSSAATCDANIAATSADLLPNQVVSKNDRK